jgi:diaminohydroxyphosphoribosylaminopyrimidine deaminase / 5-amino-6-(5-phosphoribosylamino)uracil reductase
MTAHSLSHRSVRTVAEHDDILAPLISAASSRPYVIAQLGQSLDGRIATPTGASRWINRDCALDHLHRIRANVDAVVVGIGTITADDPLLTVRRVSGPQPVRVVIDPNGRMSYLARCLADDGIRCLVVRSSEGPVPPGADAIIVPRKGPLLAPADIVAALFARGLRRILIEGGATTVSSFIDAGVVDRLHVLVAPIILGSGTTGLSLTPIRGLDEAQRPVTRVHVLDDGDVVFDCDLRTTDRG